MNRRPVLLCWAIALNAILFGSIGGAPAARLPTSTITINVLSVDRESVNREEIKHPGRPTVGFETAKFAAKAKITRVLASDHGLNAGDVIDIPYGVTVRQPPDRRFVFGRR